MHGDLHAGNIFVDSERPSEIVGIIDWYSPELAPLLSQARQPHIIDYDGPKAVGLEDAKFPDDIPDHHLAAFNQAMDLFCDMSILSLYKQFNYKSNPRLYPAIEFRETSS